MKERVSEVPGNHQTTRPKISQDEIKALGKEEIEARILLKLSHLAITSDDAREVVASAREYFDRLKGKPAQEIKQTNININVVAERRVRAQRIAQEVFEKLLPPTIDNNEATDK